MGDGLINDRELLLESIIALDELECYSATVSSDLGMIGDHFLSRGDKLVAAVAFISRGETRNRLAG